MLTNYAWASKIQPGRPQCLLSFGRMEGRLRPTILALHTTLQGPRHPQNAEASETRCPACGTNDADTSTPTRPQAAQRPAGDTHLCRQRAHSTWDTCLQFDTWSLIYLLNHPARADFFCPPRRPSKSFHSAALTLLLLSRSRSKAKAHSAHLQKRQ